MIQLLGTLPSKVYVAFSGGKDSVAFTHYLLSLDKDVTLLHFHHNLSVEDENAYLFTLDFAKKYNVKLLVGILNTPKEKQHSPEEHQRIHRYSFLSQYNDFPIIMNHNLNDNMETWLFGSINGQPKLIPYRNNNIIRPFMLVSSDCIETYCLKNNLDFYHDATNDNVNIPRNRIRHNIMKEVLEINKGFHSLIKKRIIKKYTKEIF